MRTSKHSIISYLLLEEKLCYFSIQIAHKLNPMAFIQIFPPFLAQWTQGSLHGIIIKTKHALMEDEGGKIQTSIHEFNL